MTVVNFWTQFLYLITQLAGMNGKADEIKLYLWFHRYIRV